MKKRITDWFKQDKKIITMSGIAIALLIIGRNYSQDNAYEDLEISDNLGYEDMQDEKSDNTDILTTPIIKEAENKPSEEIKNNGGGNTNKEESKELPHDHFYHSPIAINDFYEKRTCDCGEEEIVEHDFVEDIVYEYDIICMYKKENEHIKTITSTCSTCGYSKELEKVEECEYNITGYNETDEFMKCNECGNETTRKHALVKTGIAGAGFEGQLNGERCKHEGCNYLKVVEQKDNTDLEQKTTESNSIQTQLQTLHAMKEIVINGTVFEYPEPQQQYVLKK